MCCEQDVNNNLLTRVERCLRIRGQDPSYCIGGLVVVSIGRQSATGQSPAEVETMWTIFLRLEKTGRSEMLRRTPSTNTSRQYWLYSVRTGLGLSADTGHHTPSSAATTLRDRGEYKNPWPVTCETLAKRTRNRAKSNRFTFL